MHSYLNSEFHHVPEDVGHVVHPPRPVHRKYFQAILYLADRAAAGATKESRFAGRHLVEELSELVNLKDFRLKKWYREMTESMACEQLDLGVAKRAALVLMILVLKSDNRHDEPLISRVRTELGADPIVVPADLGLHKKLAFEYLGG
jgi:hypothetical protein